MGIWSLKRRRTATAEGEGKKRGLEGN